MQASGEVASLQYHAPDMMVTPHTNINTMLTHLSSFLVEPHYTHLRPPVQALQTAATKGSVAPDKLEGMSPIDERKRRRMISNRESARRSRMRKQRRLEELWSQVVYLRAENRRVVEELNRAAGDRDRVLLENSQLQDEASALRETLRRLLEEAGCSGVHMRSDASK